MIRYPLLPCLLILFNTFQDSDHRVNSRRSMSAGRHSCVAAPFAGSQDSSAISQIFPPSTTAQSIIRPSDVPQFFPPSTTAQPCRKSYRERIVAFRQQHSLSETSVIKPSRNRSVINSVTVDKYRHIIFIAILCVYDSSDVLNEYMYVHTMMTNYVHSAKRKKNLHYSS